MIIITAIRTWIEAKEIYLWVALCLFCLLFGWYVHGVYDGYKENKEKTVAIKEHTATEIKNNAIAASAEKQSSAAKTNDAITNQVITHEVTKTIYRCAIPSSGVQLINRAIAGNISSQSH